MTPSERAQRRRTVKLLPTDVQRMRRWLIGYRRWYGPTDCARRIRERLQAEGLTVSVRTVQEAMTRQTWANW